MDAKEENKIIRKYIKAHIPTVSVKMGTGTGWGWVNIAAKDNGMFTDAEIDGLRAIGLNPGGNFEIISPENRRKFAELWK